MKDKTNCIPAPSYARISRVRQGKTESGRIVGQAEFRKMIDESIRPSAPLNKIIIWKCSRVTRKREHAVVFKSVLQRKGVWADSITEHPNGKLMEAIKGGDES